jgi:hypothetical protein
MADSARILLVEGESDRGFFEEVCKSLGLDARVQVAPPKELGETRNTKGAVFNILPSLLKQLADGRFWIKGCVRPDELALLQHAQGVVAALSEPKFKPIHRAKAEVATWLAWQKRPGYGPYLAMTDNLLDLGGASFRCLADWLERIYRDH